MNDKRRLFLLAAISGIAGSASLAFAPALAGAVLPLGSATDALRAVAAAGSAPGYHAIGPDEGHPIVIALAHSQRAAHYAEAAALLAAQGFHVLLPQLRDAPAQKLGQDLLGFLDRLHLPEAVFVGAGAAADAINAAWALRRTRVLGRLRVDHATPQQIAADAVRLARQGQWRT
ncbi:hypothetical protein ABT364_17880 [Massilia sp. SR12]